MKFILPAVWVIPMVTALLTANITKNYPTLGRWIMMISQSLVFVMLLGLAGIGDNQTGIRLICMFLVSLGTLAAIGSHTRSLRSSNSEEYRLDSISLLLGLEGLGFAVLLSEDAVVLLSFLGLIPILLALLLSSTTVWRSIAALWLMWSCYLFSLLLRAVDVHNHSGGQWSFVLAELVQIASSSQHVVTASICLSIASWIGLGLWPFHHWLATIAAFERPSIGIFILVVWRAVSFYLFVHLTLPILAHLSYPWQLSLYILGMVGIVHGILVAYAHCNVRYKLVFALQSLWQVALLGILSGSLPGLLGAFMSIISQSCAAAILLIWTHDISQKTASISVWLVAIAALTFVGMPGFAGFTGNTLLFASWGRELTSSPWRAILMIVGVGITALSLSVIFAQIVAFSKVTVFSFSEITKNFSIQRWILNHFTVLPLALVLCTANVWLPVLKKLLVEQRTQATMTLQIAGDQPPSVKKSSQQ